jgi:probable HAF family extracellular repeat protein
MKSVTLRLIATLTLLAWATSVRVTAQAPEQDNHKQTHYSARELSTLGGNLGNAAGINNKGWVVGDANLTGNANEHATVWRDGMITDLGTLGGPNSSIGFIGAKPNDKGLIVGNAQSATPDPLGEGWGLNFGCTASGLPCDGSQYLFLGFIWDDGVITPLPTLGGNNAAALGRANQRGQVAGTAETATPDTSCVPPQKLDWKPVVWEASGEIRELELFPGDSVGAASAINDRGQVVGGSGMCQSPGTAALVHPVLWQNGTVTNLGSLGGAVNDFAVAINSGGQVVGLSDLSGDLTFHAFLWQNEVMSDLGTLPGDSFSLASDINDAGQVVGQSCDDAGNCRAFLWQHGAMTDLNALISLDSPLYLLSAEGINSGGEIVGWAFNQGSSETLGFLATPVGEDVPQTREKLMLPENLRRLPQRTAFGGRWAGPADPLQIVMGAAQRRQTSTGAACQALGTACTSSAQCCNRWCAGGNVHGLPRRCCAPLHNMGCTKSSDCCSGSCLNGRCL